MSARPHAVRAPKVRYSKGQRQRVLTRLYDIDRDLPDHNVVIDMPITKPVRHKDAGHTTRPLPGSSPKSLWERTGCCWPVNDGKPYLFCDEPRAPKGAYCVEHRRIGTRPFSQAWEDKS